MKINYLIVCCIATLVAPVQAPLFADEPVKDIEKTAQKTSCDAAVAHVAQPAQKLVDVKTIFVSPLGTGEGAELIRQNLINRLVESSVVTVVDSQEEADAILTGVGEVHSGAAFGASGGGSGGTFAPYGNYQSSSSFSARGGTYYSASLTVRLVGRSKKIFWVSQCQPRNPFRNSIPSHRSGLLGLVATAVSSSGSTTSSTPDGAISYAADNAIKSLAKAIRREQASSQLGTSRSPGNL